MIKSSAALLLISILDLLSKAEVYFSDDAYYQSSMFSKNIVGGANSLWVCDHVGRQFDQHSAIKASWFVYVWKHANL